MHTIDELTQYADHLANRPYCQDRTGTRRLALPIIQLAKEKMNSRFEVILSVSEVNYKRTPKKKCSFVTNWFWQRLGKSLCVCSDQRRNFTKWEHNDQTFPDNSGTVQNVTGSGRTFCCNKCTAKHQLHSASCVLDRPLRAVHRAHGTSNPSFKATSQTVSQLFRLFSRRKWAVWRWSIHALLWISFWTIKWRMLHSRCWSVNRSFFLKAACRTFRPSCYI